MRTMVRYYQMIKTNQVFIVEGPDCSGKSTLCKKLHEAFGYPVYHLTYYSDKEKMEEQFREIYQIIDRGESVIIDRFLLSNMIYGIVYHDGETISDLEKYIDYLGCNQSTLILALPNSREWWIEQFKKACTEREEMYPDEEKMKMVYNLFKQYGLILQQGCFIPNMIVYDYSKNIDTATI